MDNSYLKHSGLGPLQGVALEDSTVVQFRGIPYASIPARWHDPVPASGLLSSAVFDATIHGPACPQGSGAFQAETSLIGELDLPQPDVEYSELECLNLVVTRPAGMTSESRVPVVAWVHGGGFSIGCNAWPQYDLARFVHRANKNGKPVIAVSINYRLGIFGFLASSQYGLQGNYGLKDQACAFKWIHRYIEGFGGDPHNITAFGESAGAICLSTLLTTKEPLFTRCLIMSGDITLRRPRSIKWQDSMFHKNLQHLQIQNIDSQDSFEQLKKMSADKIVKSLPLTQHWSPTLDDIFLHDAGAARSGISKTWCKHILMGDMAHDGTVLRSRYLNRPDAMQTTISACEAILNADETHKLLSAYQLGNDREGLVMAMLHLISDLRFYMPILVAEARFKNSEDTKLSRYHIHQGNPFRGVNHGLASHELDVIYLLGNVTHGFRQADVVLSERMAHMLTAFSYGESHLCSNDEEVLFIGPTHRVGSCSPENYDLEFRNGRGRILLQLGWEKCFRLGEMLQGTPFSDVQS